VPFTLVHAGKNRTENNLNIQTKITKTKHKFAEKANKTKHSKTKLAWFSRFLQQTRWAYSTMPWAHTGQNYVQANCCNDQHIQLTSDQLITRWRSLMLPKDICGGSYMQC